MDEGPTSSPGIVVSERQASSPGWAMCENIPVSMHYQQVLPEPPCSPIPHNSPHRAGSPVIGVPLTQPTPSPGCKRFISISSNARNDIYMKTLMNSPYNKSYTPLSATPGYSPAYQTPIRNNNPSPLKGVAPSPRGVGSGPLSACKFVTPKGVVNPFDTGIDDLHKPALMSPGFFTICSTPASEKKCFQWSIEHIAELNPADIDEMPVHQCLNKPDKETEERAQKAIEHFFANNIIAPSPWSDPKKSKRKNILPATPASQGVGVVQEMMAELQGSIQKTLPPKQGMEDAACQTTLSLPVNFDLQAVLGAYMTQDEPNEGNQQEMLSTSSLRRKLFFHGDTSSVAPSPVKATSGQNRLFEPESPMFSSQNKDWTVTTPLKNTPAFSSSPIKSTGTPLHRRCSSDPDFLASPELSPIVHGNLPNSGIRKSRSSGLFAEGGEDFEISPVTDHAPKPFRSLVSPIHMNGKSSEGNFDEFHPKFVDSPGFSPIRPPKTPIRKILRRSQEESYIQDEGCSSDEESEHTPISSHPTTQVLAPTPVASIARIPTGTSGKQPFNTSYSNTNSLQTVMDVESHATTLQTRFTDNILTSSMCETRDFSSDLDFQDDTHLRTNSSNQDTGYQTASLQSTNQESVSLHTNLTNQFGSLPFNLTNQEVALQNVSQSSTNQDKPAPVMNLTMQFTSLDDVKGEKEGRRLNKSFDKNSLPKQNLFAQNMFTSDESDTETTPKNGNIKVYTDDSAFRESLSFDMDPGTMEVDGHKAELDDFYPNEEAVLSRAKQALAMANSLYPQDNGSSKAENGIMSDPSQLMAEKNTKSKLSASEFAYTILQKAGEDLAKYERMFSGNEGVKRALDPDL